MMKLIRGEYGLVNTFWLAVFLVGTVMNVIVIKLISSDVWAVLLNILVALYLIAASLGVWNAAKHYTGKKIWVFLAQLYAVLGIVTSILRVIAMTYYGVMQLMPA